MNNRRLVLVGLFNERNFGDPIIAESVAWIFNRDCGIPQDSIYKLDLNPPYGILMRFIFKISNKLKMRMLSDSLQLMLTRLYFASSLKSNDLVVVVGGGLIKYKYQTDTLALPLVSLLNVAVSRRIPIVLNAVGVEGYDSHSIYCQRLKKTISEAVLSGVLNYFSVRDDKDTFTCYLPEGWGEKCTVVADPAVWSSEVFRKEKKAGKGKIGIGVIRGKIFKDNGVNYTQEQLFTFYVNLVHQLIKEGYKQIELFTNGNTADTAFATAILRSLKLEGVDCLLKIPTSAEMLVEIISSYDAIVAARLHACIIAYSLKVPFVGLVWNDKLRFFGKNVQMESCFIPVGNLLPEVVVNQLHDIIRKGVNHDEKFRNSIREFLKSVGKEYLF